CYGIRAGTHIGRFPLELDYYDLEQLSDWWDSSFLDALWFDKLIAVRTHHQVAEGVTVGLTYALQKTGSRAPASLDDQKLLMLSVEVGF
ncbi:MAG: hypothetical protein H5T86_16000, partial [Armatimonadetes bacterium]|nr:hypothetical protein [Armatimonadota bacterium]